MRHLQPEQRQGLRTLGAQLGAEDRRVGEGVAVDLGRQGVRDAATRRDRVGVVELRHGLVDVEGAGERGLGRDAVVAQSRQSPQEHVDLDLRALGRLRVLRVAGSRSLEQPVEDGRADAAEHEAAAERLGADPADLHLAVRA